MRYEMIESGQYETLSARGKALVEDEVLKIVNDHLEEFMRTEKPEEKFRRYSKRSKYFKQIMESYSEDEWYIAYDKYFNNIYASRTNPLDD